ncbi:sorting nexin-33 [Tetranychus urticae]|uniref:Sorting nexin n=1 Tax=Tetranychus urticae TaxID=32264 RepID=T1JS13_TETUR|nr:sorting nexin-33 [Tetranychus urticae]
MSHLSTNGTAQCRVLYDFQAQPGTGELDIYADEILTVLRQDVGEGWWEGCNSRGEQGLFPAGYVELIQSTNNTTEHDFFSPVTSSSVSSTFNPPVPNFPPPSGPTNIGQMQENNYDQGDDWGDEDWDDDDSQGSGGDTIGAGAGSGSGFGSGPNPAQSSLSLASGKSQLPVKKSINRFSTFVKSGGEDFILGSKTRKVPCDAYIYIIETSSNEIMWAPAKSEYYCTITAPKKESKLKGLKTYTAYKLTPSFNNIMVSRRYKHFDWLYGCLTDKFMAIPIPWLPAKQISGRFSEEFIEHRKIQLQLWVNRICRHPVISQADVWMHFITCTDDKKRWKTGKRRAEKDEFTGGSFFYTLQPPTVPLEVTFVESRTESFGKFVKKMDESIQFMSDVVIDQCRKYSGAYKKEMQKISIALNSFASAYDTSDYIDHQLNEAIRGTGDTFDRIAKMYEEQPKYDFEPLSYVLHEYKGILSAWPEILDLNKQALGRKKDYLRLRDEGKAEDKVVESVSQRADVVSYAMLAEINHFQKERISDTKQMMKSFVQAQLEFYQRISNELSEALKMYD